ncbi:MAG: LPS export ABC transporter periplasmic protein LptC [Rikenellaceae bacterium]
MRISHNISNKVKALLIIGSALILVCCGGSKSGSSQSKRAVSNERTMTEQSDELTVVMSENGRPSYVFDAALVEGYTLAKEPYREFRKGIAIQTFKDDSMAQRDSRLTANYAIYYENRKLWETSGNVEVKKSDGKELYSEQLFWNSQTKRIYSNVETSIFDTESGDVYIGEGFESDEAMEEWSFRKLTGRMRMEAPARNPKSEESELQQSESESESQTESDSESETVTETESESQPDSQSQEQN